MHGKLLFVFWILDFKLSRVEWMGYLDRPLTEPYQHPLGFIPIQSCWINSVFHSVKRSSPAIKEMTLIMLVENIYFMTFRCVFKQITEEMFGDCYFRFGILFSSFESQQPKLWCEGTPNKQETEVIPSIMLFIYHGFQLLFI